MEEKKAKILVIGSINMDLVLNLDRSPKAGETVIGNEYSYIPGGKGANQAVAAARIGADVTFCGRVGDDDNGRILLENLKQNNVDTTYVIRDSSTQTGLAVIPVESNGENRIIVMPGANMSVCEADVDKALEKDYDAIMLQLEIPLNVVYYAAKKASRKGISVVLDAGPAMSIDLKSLKGLDILSPNESETYALTGINPDSEENMVKAAKVLQEESGAEYIVIKIGKRGAMLYNEGEYKIFPTFEDVKPVDTTAAGDSFTAAMTEKAITGGDIEKAIKYAHAVGSICVSRKGAQPSLPYADEVDKFLNARGILL